MSDPSRDPWLTIVGLGEDGPEALIPAARAALLEAEVIMGPPRHLELLGELSGEIKGALRAWPVPFSDGVEQLLALNGRRVVALASGDPFWFGAGSVLVDRLDPGAWRAFPGTSVFALAASRLGWRLEQAVCLGLHAAPLSRLRPHLAPGARIIATLRDGAAVGELAAYLQGAGFGETVMHVCEALGGPRESVWSVVANDYTPADVQHPVAVALEPVGEALPLASGRPDALFDNDGQITKRPVRALTLSALCPRPGEHLWDIGGGSGSIGIEWLMCGPSMQATAIEGHPERAARIRENAARLGQDRLKVVEGRAPEALDALASPDAVFIGGGLSRALLDWLFANATGARLVANAVTLESEALLAQVHGERGGDLMRVEIAQAGPLGPRRGWKFAYPILQWSVTL